jgi:hypothetical protein
VSTTTSPSYGQPALIGGAIIGVLSALPVIAAGNLCCCMWVIGGGAVAAYVLQQNHSTPITPGDGALVGLLAGLVGALVQFVIAIPIGMMVAPFERVMLGRIVEMAGTMPPEMRDAIERYSSPDRQFGIAAMMAARVFALIVGLFVGAIFATIGGLIGAMIFKKSTPPGVIDIPPQS